MAYYNCEEEKREKLRKIMAGRINMRSLLILIAIVAMFIVFEKTDAAPTANISDLSAMRYLSQYGYLPSVNPENGGIISEESMFQAISEFQALAGINITGSMNEETSYYMSLSRCGVKDKVGPSYDGRSKRYALQGRRCKRSHPKRVVRANKKFSEIISNA